MHKLMIEAEEETYLQTATTFAPMNSETWLNRGYLVVLSEIK